MRKLSAWVDGAPVSASKSSLRMEGDVIRHRYSGDLQARRLSDGHILYRARGVSESANPTHFQVAGDLAELSTGYKTIKPAGKWNPQTKQWCYPEPIVTHEWTIPENMHLCTPVPGILLTLSTVRPLTPDLVDLGTMLEWTRVQAIIKSRSKNIRKDGHVGYFMGNLADNSEESSVGYWDVDLIALNKVRALFLLGPLPPFESPIDGLALSDFKNLHALAAS